MISSSWYFSTGGSVGNGVEETDTVGVMTSGAAGSVRGCGLGTRRLYSLSGCPVAIGVGPLSVRAGGLPELTDMPITFAVAEEVPGSAGVGRTRDGSAAGSMPGTDTGLSLGIHLLAPSSVVAARVE